MKVLRKIGDFFAAMVPFIVFWAVQLVVIILGVLVAIAEEMMVISALPESISDESADIIILLSYVVCLIVAIGEMKIHRFSFKDISPVKQNGKVYIMAVIFGLGAFFVFKFLNSLSLQIAGITETRSGQEMVGVYLIITLLTNLIEPFMEELVFRGLMVKTFEKRFPVWFSAAAITLSFLLLHSENFKCFLLLFGAALIFVRYKFGDLRLCILIHLAVNLASSVMLFVSDEYYSTAINIGAAVGIVFAAARMFFMLRFASKPAEALEKT